MHQRGEHRVDPGKQVELEVRDLFGKGLEVARIRDQHVLATLCHHREAVPLEREDVIERQRRDGDDRFDALVRIGLPGDGLLDVEDHVAMTQHRTLRHPGRAARVLQVRDIGIAELDA